MSLIDSGDNCTTAPWCSSLILPGCVLCPKSKTYEECQSDACDMDIFSYMSPNTMNLFREWVIRFDPQVYQVNHSVDDKFGRDTDGWKLVRTIIQALLDSEQGRFISNGASSKNFRFTERAVCCTRNKLYQNRTTAKEESILPHDVPESHPTANAASTGITTKVKPGGTVTSLPLTVKDKCPCRISIRADDNSYYVPCGVGNSFHNGHPRGNMNPTQIVPVAAATQKRRFPTCDSESTIDCGGDIASTSSATTTATNVYETDESLHMYYGLHYPISGTVIERIPSIIPHDQAPIHGLHFPQRVAHLLCRLMDAQHKPSKYRNALDVGCAVGGAAFELAKRFDHVDGFDYSASFISAAKRMQSQPETVRFRIPIEADLYEEVQAVHNEGVTESIRRKVTFFTGDACRMEEMVNDRQLRNDYDGMVLSNLLCRLPDPMACLDGLSSIVRYNGIVVIVTPYSWLTEYTARDQWLGGYIDPVTNRKIYSKDQLQQYMEERGFIKIHEEQIPLLIREHQRKYQYIVSEATGWRKQRANKKKKIQHY